MKSLLRTIEELRIIVAVCLLCSVAWAETHQPIFGFCALFSLAVLLLGWRMIARSKTVFASNDKADAPDTDSDVTFAFPAIGEGLFIPYGQYPHPAGMQLFDEASGKLMVAEFGKLMFKLQSSLRNAANANGFRTALPIYIGHPDDKTKAINGKFTDTSAYGWVTGIELKEGGILLTVQWGEAGEEMVKDKRFLYFSPFWAMSPTGQPGTFRPVKLISVGMTNQPNIPVPPMANDRDAANDGNFDAVHMAKPVKSGANVAPAQVDPNDLSQAQPNPTENASAPPEKPAPQAQDAQSAKIEAEAVAKVKPASNDEPMKLTDKLKSILGITDPEKNTLSNDEAESMISNVHAGMTAAHQATASAAKHVIGQMMSNTQAHVAGIMKAHQALVDHLAKTLDVKKSDMPDHLKKAQQLAQNCHQAGIQAAAAHMAANEAIGITPEPLGKPGSGLGGTINLPAGFEGVAAAPHISAPVNAQVDNYGGNPNGSASRGDQAVDDPSKRAGASNDTDALLATRKRWVGSELSKLVAENRVLPTARAEEETRLLAMSNDGEIETAIKELQERKPLKTKSEIPALGQERREILAANERVSARRGDLIDKHIKTGLKPEDAWNAAYREDPSLFQ